MKQNKNNRYMPLLMAVCVMVGILMGTFFANRFSGNRLNIINSGSNRLNNLLHIIDDQYVDKVNIDSLVEKAMPQILAELDPHSVYISAKDVQLATDDLKGSFFGVGIEFVIREDTVHVQGVIANGPAEKAGVIAGDKIISVDDKPFVGKGVTNEEAMKRLKGPKDTKVKTGVMRYGEKKPQYFTITRGDIPMNSVDASYMIDKTTGYVKVSQFGRNTYNEFVNALNSLKSQGAKRFMIDLRGNGGGYLEIAIVMINEFLPSNRLIVSTKGRYRRDETTAYSDGRGQFQNEELVVLIDEFSASASEIFAGAIQDNDRGLIIGCRSFGKGLVQKQFDLPDKSAVRLTIAKYYTPSGRCIQKPYNNGESAYQKDLLDRYSNGELYSRDSIKIDKSKIFETTPGRKVYGGGGIIPDIFVPRDTAGFSSYYAEVAGAGLFQEYALRYVTSHRASLGKMNDYKQLMRNLPGNDMLLNDFVKFAADKGVPARWYYIHQSQDIITSIIKALIARDILGQSAYYPIINRSDKTIDAALKALNKHKAAFPITDY